MTSYEETKSEMSEHSEQIQVTEQELRAAAEQFLQREGAPQMSVDEVLGIPEIYQALTTLVHQKQVLEIKKREIEEREAEVLRLRKEREAEEQKRREEQARRQLLLGMIAQEQQTLEQEVRRYTPADLSAPLVVEEPKEPQGNFGTQFSTKLHELVSEFGEILPEIVFHDSGAACGYRGWLAMHHRDAVHTLRSLVDDDPIRPVYLEQNKEFQGQFRAIERVILAHGLDPRTDRCESNRWAELRRHFDTDWRCAHLAEEPDVVSQNTPAPKVDTDHVHLQQEIRDMRDSYAARLMEIATQTDLHHHSAEAILRGVAKRVVRQETLSNLPKPTEALKMAAIQRQLKAEELGKVQSGEVHETASFLAKLAGLNGDFLAVVSQHQHGAGSPDHAG